MSETKSHPNLVLVMTDQHRWDCLSMAGHPHVMTPNLDSLARRGAWFRSAYSDCPTCIPARHCLMTGQKPSTTGVVGFNTRARIATENTLPNLLRKAGYQTASIGRAMHQYPGHARYGFETKIGNPLADRYSKFHDIFRSSDKGPFRNWPHLNTHGLSPIGSEARPWPYPEEFHETNYAINRAVEFLDGRDKGHPFFMYVGVTAPHPPLVPPQCYFDRYMGMDLDEPVLGDWVDPLPDSGRGYSANYSDRVKLSGRFNQSCRAGYFGLINHFDDQLNILLSRLAMEGEETYILFTSDHGEMLGDHERFRKAQGFEASAHVPMILQGPGIAENTVVDRAVALSDILPTFMDLAGLEPPGTVDGLSVLPDINGNPPSRIFIHGEHAPLGSPGQHFLTDGKRKYIWFTESGEELFFNLEEDPMECRNLARLENFTDELNIWRQRLVKELRDRPEGFSNGEALIAGRTYADAMPHAVVDA